MAKQTVNIGVTANDNTGDPLRTAFDKLNDNFDEVYAAGPVGTNIQISDNTIASTNTNGNIDLDPAGTGKVILNGPTEANGVITLNSTFTGNILPTTANTYNLGSSSAPFKEIFVSNGSLHIGNLVLKEVDTMLEVFQADGVTNAILSGNSTTSGTVLNNGNTVVALTQNGPITFYANNYQDPNATATVINSGNIVTPALSVTGNIDVDTIFSSGSVVASSIVQGASVISTGNVEAVGSVVGQQLISLGDTMTTGNVGGLNFDALGNVNVTGDVVATNLWGVLQTNQQPNVTLVGTLSSLNVSGDLTMTSNAAVMSTYDIHANGTVTADTLQTTTGNTSLSDSGITLSDGTTQTTAFQPQLVWRSSNGSPIGQTFSDALGGTFNLEGGKHYELMGHVIVENSSNGNVQIEFTDSTSSLSDDYTVIITSGESPGGINSTIILPYIGNVTTIHNSATRFHLQVVGSMTPSANTTFGVNIATTAGTVTPLIGSHVRLMSYNVDQLGDVN